jgi:hypothetical protein
MIGHIKIDRKILNWEWYNDCKMVHLFIHLLIKANWTDGTWRGRVIKRGQYMTSVAKLSGNTGLSVSQVRTCLAKLQGTGEIANEMTSSNTLITICKYETYQSEKKQDSIQVIKQLDTPNSKPDSKPDSNNIRKQEDKNNTATGVVVEMQEIGISLVKKIANNVWSDKAWIETLCMANGLKMDGAKDWMSQFNLSISQDAIDGFDEKKYKKMFGGWLRMKLGGGQKINKVSDTAAKEKDFMKSIGL